MIPGRPLAALFPLLLLIFPTVQAVVPIPGEAAAEASVHKAQSVFEQGESLWQAGRHAEAVRLFDRSHQMLLDAEAAAHGAFAERFYRIYELYYDARQRYDGVSRIDRKLARKTTHAAFGETPISTIQIQYQVDFMVSHRRSFLDKAFRRALKYIPMIRSKFQAAGVPPALAYMALVESGFRETPRSGAGARGLFQFMPATARRFGLRVDSRIDERLDPEKSTTAAASYLAALHREFDDWPLAVAAYNCGEGRVRRTLKRTGASTFWELADREVLPRETIDYVPRIIAVTLIARDPARLGFSGFTPAGTTTR